MKGGDGDCVPMVDMSSSSSGGKKGKDANGPVMANLCRTTSCFGEPAVRRAG